MSISASPEETSPLSAASWSLSATVHVALVGPQSVGWGREGYDCWERGRGIGASGSTRTRSKPATAGACQGLGGSKTRKGKRKVGDVDGTVMHFSSLHAMWSSQCMCLVAVLSQIRDEYEWEPCTSPDVRPIIPDKEPITQY